MFRLETLGSLALTDGPAAAVTTQRRRLALLALLAVAGERGLTRDKLVAYLWPDSSSANARHALEQLLYGLRRQLGDSALLGPDPLRLNPDSITSDVALFGQAIARGAPAEAVELYRGPFLDGFYLSDTAEFERWAGEERSHLARKYACALEGLADAARDGSDHAAEIGWRRRLVATDPLNGGSALSLMRALASGGDGAGALQYARVYEAQMREELDSVPDPPFMVLVQELRAAQTAAAAAVEPASPGAGVGLSPSQHVELAPLTVHTLREHPTTEQLRAVKAREGVLRRPAFGRPSLRIVAALSAIVTMITGAVLAFVWQPHRSLDETDPRLVAVFPFRVAGAAPELSYLREGMVDLLAIKLTGEGGPRAADPRAVLSAWRRGGGSIASDPGAAEVLRIARGLHAGRLIDGGVVGTAQHVTLTASVLLVPSGRTGARASVEGSSDSLLALVDRLTAQLLAGEAGSTELASLTSLPALRAYFDGQRAYRLGHWSAAMRAYDEALRADSTFGLAALGVYSARLWGMSVSGIDVERAQRLAWAYRERLSARDRTLVRAVLGPNYPGPSTEADFLKVRKEATATVPDSPEMWYELGDEYFHFGAIIGVEDPLPRAADAFRRSLALDSAKEVSATYSEPLQHLAEIAAIMGDTAAVRRLAATALAADSTSENAGFFSWIAAIASADRQTLGAVRARFSDMSPSSLTDIVNMSEELGRWEDAELSIAAFRASSRPLDPRGGASIGTHSLSLNRGRPREAMLATTTMPENAPHERLRWRVLDALYWDGDTAAGSNAARQLARSAEAPVAASAEMQKVQSGDLCVTQQWRLAHRDSSVTRVAIRRLYEIRPDGTGSSVPSADPNGVCAAVLEAWLATIARRPDAIRLLDRADSLLVTGVGDAPVLPPNIVVSRLRDVVGDRRGALAAIRRRMYGFQPWFLSTYLREEGRLAALSGDTRSAISAYRRYLALRSDPDPSLRPAVEQVRTELAALVGATR